MELLKKYDIVNNPDTPIEVMCQFVDDENFTVRRRLASRHDMPIEILEKLSQDESIHVRCDVANNPKTPSDILEKLSQDREKYVRCNVAINPNAPLSILEKLSQDEFLYIRLIIKENLVYQGWKFDNCIKGTNHIWGKYSKDGEVIYKCACFLGSYEELLERIKGGDSLLTERRLELLEKLNSK